MINYYIRLTANLNEHLDESSDYLILPMRDFLQIQCLFVKIINFNMEDIIQLLLILKLYITSFN